MKLEDAKLGIRVKTTRGNLGVIDNVSSYAHGYVRVALESGYKSITRAERLKPYIPPNSREIVEATYDAFAKAQ